MLTALPEDTAACALKHLQLARTRYAEFERQSAYAAAKGRRPKYCPHGMVQWTDADVFCGECEEYGQDWDYLQELRLAIDSAKAIEAKVNARREVFAKAILLGTDKLPVWPLIDWVNDAWGQWLTIGADGKVER